MSNQTHEIKAGAIGRGLFARVPFRKGARVIEYTGEKIPNKFADALTTRYLFDLENGFTIDGEDEDNSARYVNHSCEPNCEAQIEKDRVFFYALRSIKPGEEITIDYGKEYFDEFIKPEGCKCAKCTSSTGIIYDTSAPFVQYGEETKTAGKGGI